MGVDKIGDIVYAIIAMDVGERIARLWEHPANVHSKELLSLAMAVGRDLRPGGKHLMAVKPGRPPFPIPTHPGTLKKGTVRRILKRLIEDYELERQELDGEGE